MTQTQSLRMLNWPSPELAGSLSPNGRVHHMVRARNVKRVHERVAITARVQELQPMTGLVTVQPVWTFGQRRARDMDNFSTGVLKACLDGLVRGKWLEKDDSEHVRLMPPEFHVEKGTRSLELRFEWEAAV